MKRLSLLTLVFAALSALFFLPANSINNLAENLAKEQVLDITGSDIYRLAYFFDEYLSHYLWHIGVLGLAAAGRTHDDLVGSHPRRSHLRVYMLRYHPGRVISAGRSAIHWRAHPACAGMGSE